MNKQEKNQEIENLTASLNQASVFYLADTSGLTVEEVNNLRRECFKREISMRVVKNTLLKKAMDRVEGKDYSPIHDVLSGPTSILFSEVGNAPAKLIKHFRKEHDKPILKAAYIEEEFYQGDDKLQALVEIKSKEELLGEVITLLQSPIKNVVGALESSKHKLAGIVKTLSERDNQ